MTNNQKRVIAQGFFDGVSFALQTNGFDSFGPTLSAGPPPTGRLTGVRW